MIRWPRNARAIVATALVLVLAGGLFVAVRIPAQIARTTVVAYFENSTGVFPGDHVRIRGVPVGKVEAIEPQPARAKITFSFDSKYKVPDDAKAVILAPQLVTGRAVQLTPPYRRADDGERRGDPPRSHRGAGRMGRSTGST